MRQPLFAGLYSVYGETTEGVSQSKIIWAGLGILKKVDRA